MFKITPDVANRRVEVDFVGNYANIDQPTLSRELRAAILAVKGSGHFDLLCDFSRIHVMPQDRAEQSRDEIEWCLANGLRRSANVVSSAISRMQLQRLAASDRFGNFATREEAIAWLDSPE